MRKKKPDNLFASLKLTQEHRHALMRFAARTIVCEAEEAEEARGFQRAFHEAYTRLRVTFPQSDLEVLARYKLTRRCGGFAVAVPKESEPILLPCTCRDVRAEAAAVERAPMPVRSLTREDDDASLPLIAPASWVRSYSYGDVPHATLPPEDNEGVLLYVLAWQDAVKAHDKARAVVMRDLRTVVKRASTLQDVVDYWLPAGDLYEALGGVPAIDAEMQERLKRARVVGAP